MAARAAWRTRASSSLIFDCSNARGGARTYIDRKCPFTGTVFVRGRIMLEHHSAKMNRAIIVHRNCLHFVKKYQRYEQRHPSIPAHISPFFRVKE